MPKYKVLRPIEHNEKFYLPESLLNPARPDVVTKVNSSGSGREIPVDKTGVIELTAAEAAAMTLGQIEPVKKKT